MSHEDTYSHIHGKLAEQEVSMKELVEGYVRCPVGFSLCTKGPQAMVAMGWMGGQAICGPLFSWLGGPQPP